MRILSIQSKLYMATVFFLLIVSFVALNHYFHNHIYSVDHRFHCIVECEQTLSDIIINEQVALADLSSFGELFREYDTINKMCLNCHSGSNNAILTHLNSRQTTFQELFEICRENKNIYAEASSMLSSSVEELMQAGSGFEKLFIGLLTAEEKKRF